MNRCGLGTGANRAQPAIIVPSGGIPTAECIYIVHDVDGEDGDMMVHCRHPENRKNPCKMEKCPRFSYSWLLENYMNCSYKSNYPKDRERYEEKKK